MTRDIRYVNLPAQLFHSKEVVTASAQSTAQPSPALAPEVVSCYRYSWAHLWKNFLELFLIFIVSVVLGGPSGIPYVGWIYSILIDGPAAMGLSFAYLKAARGNVPEPRDVFQAFKHYWNAVLASLLVSIIVVGGLILLVVPGVIFAIKLSFTPYLITDRKMEAVAAVKESWRMTNGHALDIFLLDLLAIPIVIAGLLALVVGVIPAMMWVELAFASMYHAVSQANSAPEQTTAAVLPSPPTP